MQAEHRFSKLTRSFHNFMNRQWSKVRCPTTIEQLEEEYETLLREIDYLVPAKSYIFNFQSKPSEDLTKILKGHSKEVLETYIANHENHTKIAPLGNRNDLIHYVTEIIVSRPKCNHKLCKCKPKKVSNEIPLDIESPSTAPKKNIKDTQPRNSMETAFQKSNNFYQNRKVDAEIQTDDWNHDPNCTCGCCPKLSSQVIVKNSIEEGKVLQDATTSDKQIVPFDKVFTNCTQTLPSDSPSEEKERKCVPDNFEYLLSNPKNQFSTCVAKHDCACGPYDVEEAIKVGLILPGSDICIQKKKGTVNKEKKKSKKNREYITTSDNDAPSESSSSSEKEKKTKKSKKEENKKNKKRRSSSNMSMLRNANNKKDETTTGCFGLRKKKKLCEEHCQGVVGRQCSIQTMPITQKDKGEEAYLYGGNNRKAAHTSTDSEIGTQMSASYSKQTMLEDKKTNKEDKEINEEYKEISQTQTSLVRKASKTKQEDKQNSKEAMVCDKCGRQRRDCHTACRNTIILPYGSKSRGAMPAGEAESLRMLIKMQNKDTNRQFTSLINELNSQKSEIQRLNNMYQKMVENFYEPNKSSNQNKKKAEMYECGCTSAAKSCGCSFNRECTNKKGKKMDNGSHNNTCCCSCDGRVGTKMADEKSQDKDAPKRFGPPNTVVAINICNPNSPDLGKNNSRTNANHLDGNQKQRREKFKPKNAIYKNEGSGDSVSNSLSTLYMMRKSQKTPSFEDIPLNIQQILDKIDVIGTGSNDDEPPEKHSNKSGYSSRVLVWLKKSWVNLKGKKSECEQKEQEQDRAKRPTNVLHFCQSAGKRAVVELLNVIKGKK